MENRQNIKEIRKGDDGYPKGLMHVYKPPEVIYAIGSEELLSMPFVAVVGSRKCSEYGKQTALKIGKALSRAGIGVISGMAMGIDSFGHLGALKNGGKTAAVLGCGADVCYPAENRRIYDQITEEGLVLSEYAPGSPPRPYCFPQRNRLIAGIAEAVVVVEAGTRSGALITAELGAELGKSVYAVPGNINNPCSLGTNKLIADGVMPLVVIEDLIRDLGGTSRPEEEGADDLGEDETRVIALLREEGEVSMEYMCAMLGKKPVEMTGIVAVLEIKGLVAYSFGKIFLAK